MVHEIILDLEHQLKITHLFGVNLDNRLGSRYQHHCIVRDAATSNLDKTSRSLFHSLTDVACQLLRRL